MKAGTHNHVKMKRLKRLLAIPLYRAVGILETLWQLCIECCDEGNVGKFTDAELADYLEWEGDPSELIRSLTDAGWLDTDGSGRPSIHGWLEHCPEFIWDRIRKREARAVKSAKRDAPVRTETTYDLQEPDADRTIPDKSENVPSIPNPTQPNPTNPDPTNPTNRDAEPPHSEDACGGRAGGLDFSRGWGTVANRLTALGATRWREAIADAKQCGCTPGHAMEILAYAKSKGYQVGAVIFRLTRARPTLPLEQGWPPLEQPEQIQQRKATTKAERERLAEEDYAAKAKQSEADGKELERRFGQDLDAMDPAEVAEICRPNPPMAKLLKKGHSPLLREWLLRQLETRATA